MTFLQKKPAGYKASVASWPKCEKRCGRKVKGPYSKMCTICFLRSATKSGTWSNGNKNARGSIGNIGNKNARGSIGNAGNMKKGRTKKRAGHRSGIKRSAKYALVVKKQWLDLILAKEKDWEIRGCATNRRGWIHFAESQAGGKLIGRARLVDCVALQRKSFQTHYAHHRVSDISMVPYKTIYAWVLEDAERFVAPFKYFHQVGAVI